MKTSHLLSLLCCMAMSAAASDARGYFHPFGLAFPRWNNGMPWWTGYWVDPQLIHPRVPAAPERIECWYRLEKTVGCVYSIFQFFYGKTQTLSPECCYRVRTIGDECAESVFTRFADGFDKKIKSHCALPSPAAAAPH